MLSRHLRSLGVPDAVIEAAGLARRNRRGTLTDTFRDRAILPIRSVDGTVLGFIGRASDAAAPGVPKYVNSPRTCLYDKGKVLFGLAEARPLLAGGVMPVIVEGPFDAIAVTICDPQRFAGLAPCGTALTASQIASLDGVAALRAPGVLVAFDADQAGRRAAVRSYHQLSPFTSRTWAAELPPGRDPAGILASEGPVALAAALSKPRPLADLVVDAELDRWSRWLAYPEGRINAVRAVAPLIAAMPAEHVGRQVARISDRLGMDHATVTRTVADEIPRALETGTRGPKISERQKDGTFWPADGAGRGYETGVMPGASKGTCAGRRRI